jgi:hypothetical protein
MSQIARRFDPETMRKIKNGIAISLTGLLVTVLPVLASELSAWLDGGDPVNWSMVVGMCVSALSTAAVNALKQWLAGHAEATQ